MKTDPIGLGLGFLRRLGSGNWATDRARRRKVENVIEGGTRLGFKTIASANRRFKPVRKLLQPTRPTAATDAPDRFDLTPTEDQQAYLDAVDRLVDEIIAPAAVAADEAKQPPIDVLQAIHDLGITLLAAPEALDGAGGERTIVTHTLMAEVLARGDMGIALAALSPLSVVNGLMLWGNAAQQSRYIPALIGEEFVAASLAINESGIGFDPLKPTTKASHTTTGWVLNGTKTLVPLSETAELFLVTAQTESRGLQLFCLERQTKGVVIEATPAMGLHSAGLGKLILKDVCLDDATRLEADFVAEEFLALNRIGSAALACGTSQAALDYALPYIKERKAFGEPVAYRQSVAFIAADIAIELEGLRLMNWRAASLAEQGRDYRRAALLSELQAGEYSMQIGNQAVQLLGGHGYTTEHPVERYYRDLRAIAILNGGVMV